MRKRLLATAIAVLFCAGLSFAAGTHAQKMGKTETLTGVITDTHCGLGPHMGPPAECVKKCVSMGAKYALASHGKVYVIEPQSLAADHPGGSHVRIRGKVEGMTIHATSIMAVK